MLHCSHKLVSILSYSHSHYLCVSFIFNTIFALSISHFIIILSFQSQNFSFSQILSSIDICHPLGLTPRLFGPAHVFMFTVTFFSFFLSFSLHYYSLFLTFVSFSLLF